MTVKEFIVKNELRSAAERLAKLKELGAPDIMIVGQNKIVDELKAGKIKISGAVEKLENEVMDFEVKKGRGGKQYVEFSDGTMCFPNARYGRYIK